MDARRHTLRFKVQLRDIKPAIWRRFEVPASYTFWDLHVAIRDAMGWLDCHLHAWEVPIRQYLNQAGARAEYEDDFGDGWDHDLLLEAVGIRHVKTKYRRCLAGARACPPEDCGGPGGYAELLETISDPARAEYESTLTWLGGPFDPEVFDPHRVRFDNPKKRWRVVLTDG